MSSASLKITRHAESGMPVMLAQAVVMAAAFVIGECICAPLYVSFAPKVFPVMSWASVAILFSTIFSFVVGFVLLWCAESFAYRMPRKAQPVVYAVIGAIGFAVWTAWVMMSVMNSITMRLGVGDVTTGGNMTLAVVNGALLGLAAFFFAFTMGEFLAKYRTAMIVVALVVIALAIFGGYVYYSMMNTVSTLHP